jgi:hypothetical protein
MSLFIELIQIKTKIFIKLSKIFMRLKIRKSNKCFLNGNKFPPRVVVKLLKWKKIIISPLKLKENWRNI